MDQPPRSSLISTDPNAVCSASEGLAHLSTTKVSILAAFMYSRRLRVKVLPPSQKGGGAEWRDGRRAAHCTPGAKVISLSETGGEKVSISLTLD